MAGIRDTAWPNLNVSAWGWDLSSSTYAHVRGANAAGPKILDVGI